MKKVIISLFISTVILFLININTQKANAYVCYPSCTAVLCVNNSCSSSLKATSGDLISLVKTDIGLYANMIKMQGVEISNWSVKSDDIIEFTLPNDVSPGYMVIYVYHSDGDLFADTSLSIYSKPNINSINPQAVIPGSSVITILGENFGDTFIANSLKVGSLYITKVYKWTDTEVSFLAPNSLQAGVLSLRSYDSQAGRSEWAEGGNIYIQPAITKLSKVSGIGGDIITIYGANFINNFPPSFSGANYLIRVYFNNVPADMVVGTWISASVSALVPENATTGNIKIEISSNEYTTLIAEGPAFTILDKISSDTYSHLQTYLKQTNVTNSWSYGYGSSNVVVAVIDDGVYTGHPDLVNNMWINSGEIEGNNQDDDNNGFIDDRWGWDFISNSKDMTTRGSHGTMVAGIIGAKGNNNAGIAGINWNVKLMPLITCDSEGCDSEAIVQAIKYAVDNGADIINLSLAGHVFNYTDYYNEIIKYAFDRNVLVVIATGNGDIEGGIGRNLNTTKVSPVCNDLNQNMVLGVGAVDSNNQLTSWSNYGGCADIYAPGVNIVSSAVPAYSTLGGFYDSADGTSFSAPMVSGIAALIKAKYPSIKNTAIRDRIINNFDYQNGIKVINAYKAISQTYSDSEKYISNINNTLTPITTDLDISTNTILQTNSVVDEERQLVKNIDSSLARRVSGNILLQVEKNGEGWYVYPEDNKKYYLGRPADAYSVMRFLSLGISNVNLIKAQNDINFAKRYSGRIFLQVEAHGEAYYVDFDGKLNYMKDGEAAYDIMRGFGLGITNSDIRKIDVGDVN